MRILSLLIFIVLLSLVSFAGTSPYIATGIQVVAGTGYHNPIVFGRFGAENFGERFYVNGYAEIDPLARKLETGDGYNYGGLGEAYYIFKRSDKKAPKWFAGGGAVGTRQVTSDWAKGAIHPFIGGGVDGKWYRLTLRYKFVGTDDRNGSHGVDGQVEWKLTKNWRLLEGFAYARFYYTDVPAWTRNGFATTLGAKYVF